MAKTYVSLKGEEIKRKVHSDIWNRFSNQDEHECRIKAKQELRFLEEMANLDAEESGNHVDLQERFFKNTNSYRNVRFEGKLIIRPYKSINEAALDGYMGAYDTGLLASSICGEYLFMIRLASEPDRAYGYILFSEDGELLRARRAFNLDIENKTVLNYIELFRKDVLGEYMLQKKAAV